MEENDGRREESGQQETGNFIPLTPPEEDQAPPWEQPKRPKRRAGRIVCIALLAVIVGTALALRLVDVMMDRVQQWEALPPILEYYDSYDYDDGYDYDEYYGYDWSSNAYSSLLLERAPTGGDAAIAISAGGAEALSLQEIYKKASPSVVGIEGSLYTGTGIVLSEDGYILTNCHVVAGNTYVKVCLSDQTRYDALLVGGDEKSDLAVLKIDATGLTPAEFGDSAALEVGDLAVAIGNPLGMELQGTMTDGIISAINRDVEVDGRVMTLLQTNAALNSGNSGGPLLNSAGQVVGINSLKMSSRYSSIEGLGFAIPVATAKPIVDQLIQYGYATGTPAFGITVRGLRDGDTEVSGTKGIYVESVNERSDAYEKGLRPGDIILKLDGNDVRSVSLMEEMKVSLTVGDTVTLTIQRDGAEMDLNVTVMDQLDFKG